ncbi:hypothetical protein [Streptomyces flavalbus]|uniref:Uncharacterized protein n=1 Tax=Streptomyces flavalbus TaxID=2665155 RepID=A0ABW2WJ77_9ACTN
MAFMVQRGILGTGEPIPGGNREELLLFSSRLDPCDLEQQHVSSTIDFVRC